MNQPQKLTPRAALAVGRVSVALGSFPILALIPFGIGAPKIRWTTGAWPKNEEFITRQKAKSLLGRFARKPPPETK